MTQPSLFDRRRDPELERVRSRIERAVLAFFDKYPPGVFFHLATLLGHVEREVGSVAPDSPGRIMRQLRAKGRIGYRVTNRAQSYYEITKRA